MIRKMAFFADFAKNELFATFILKTSFFVEHLNNLNVF